MPLQIMNYQPYFISILSIAKVLVQPVN